MAFACVFENRLLQNLMVNVNQLITIFPIRTPFWRYTPIFRHVWVSSVTTLAHQELCRFRSRSPMGVIPVELFGWWLDIRIYLMLIFFLTYIYIYTHRYTYTYTQICKYTIIYPSYTEIMHIYIFFTAGRVCYPAINFVVRICPASEELDFNWLLLIWK